jgi:hypothetical protein
MRALNLPVYCLALYSMADLQVLFSQNYSTDGRLAEKVFARVSLLIYNPYLRLRLYWRVLPSCQLPMHFGCSPPDFFPKMSCSGYS